MSVTVASRLERLVRFVPGVAGYQDRENSRATDKQVRMRLVQEIGRLIKGLDDDKERLARSADLSRLPRLDRLAGRLERQSRIVEFASRGYTGSSTSTRWTRRRSISSTPSTWDSSMR